ncbi:MAG: nucleotidyltransferase [Dehalococcoidia bacterium]|nr:MAG: nucleotidyltransferase [Dehalococcoidia bacterium]
MKAVVMAGGEGSRLRPLTIGRPKPMVQVVNRPCIEHILLLLKRHGITEVIVTLQYLAEQIQDYFGDGSSLGMHITYSIEESPLGTAGSVGLARNHLTDTFLVISGDALTDFDLSKIIANHREKRAEATLTLYSVPNPLEYGVVIINENGAIRQFLEKPSWGEVFSDTVNTGIYVLEPSIFDYIPTDRSVDFSADVFPRMLADGRPIFGYVASGYWCDIGSIPEYHRASGDLLAGRVNLGSIGIPHPERPDVYLESEEVEIAPDAIINGPVYLGSDCQIKSGAVIYGPSVVRSATVVDVGAQIDRSIIWRGAYIGERAEVRGAIVCRQVTLKPKAMVFEGAVIGDNTVVGESAIIQPGVKIWPDKEIEAGATVSTSIIWGSQGRRNLFSRYGISGLVNIDLTPEFAAKLGAAYGATLPKGSSVIMSRDPHHTPRMIKRALIAGVPSAGVDVIDVKSVPIPVVRYITRVTDAIGGVHVRLSPYDTRIVDIKLFDANGLDIDKPFERKIENTFFREDFRRTYLDEIGRIAEAPQLVERYIEGYRRSLDLFTMPPDEPTTIVVDYAHATASNILPILFSQLGLNVVSLNAAIDETKLARSPQEFDESMRQLAAITAALRANMGVRLEPGGEKIYVVDDTGEVVDGALLAAMVASMVFEQHPGATIAVPVSAPRVFDDLADRYGGVVIRTKVNQQALMAAAIRHGVEFVADLEGGLIFPSFSPAMDGLFAVLKLVELLSRTRRRLASLARTFPPFYLMRRQVRCPWEAKGRVMRLLNEQFRDRQTQQVDGVKVDLGREWVLVLPDPDRPLFHVIAESNSAEGAQALLDKYAGLVAGLQGER